MQDNSRAFTLIEVLATVAIIALLAGLVLPALSRSRESANTLVCATHLREMAKGWQTYADDNEGTLMPLRIPEAEENLDGRADLREVGNGLKILPRWPVLIGAEIGIPAFEKPSRTDERQDYDDPFYQCPAARDRVDERNYAYGYNYQFLGNSLRHYSRRDQSYNYPVKQVQITSPSGTILFGDSMGTAAGFRSSKRRGYDNDGAWYEQVGNLAYRLDPPRFNTLPFMGVGGPGASGPTGSLRTAVDPRHRGKCNVVFGDSHTETKTPRQLGYAILPDGIYADVNENENVVGAPGLGTSGLRANNRLFSGTGRDSNALLVILDR